MYPSDRKYTKNHEWVTIAGGEKLEEPYVIRPTSETVSGLF